MLVITKTLLEKHSLHLQQCTYGVLKSAASLSEITFRELFSVNVKSHITRYGHIVGLVVSMDRTNMLGRVSIDIPPYDNYYIYNTYKVRVWTVLWNCCHVLWQVGIFKNVKSIIVYAFRLMDLIYSSPWRVYNILWLFSIRWFYFESRSNVLCKRRLGHLLR